MMRAIIMAMLLAPVIAVAEVEIEVITPPQPAVCPIPQPQIVKNPDGSYTRPAVVGMTLQACFSQEVRRKERWTDYPENGGQPVQAAK